MMKKKKIIIIALFFIMCGMFADYDRNFQADSETLVTAIFRENLEQIEVNTSSYYLGRYKGVDGVLGDYSNIKYPKGWENGYSHRKAAFIIFDNDFTRKLVDKLEWVKDKQGNEYRVKDYVIGDDGYIRINLSTDSILTKVDNGMITELQFFDKVGNRLSTGVIHGYASQFGLQGMIFSQLAPKNVSYKKVRNIDNAICIVVLAAILVAISYFVGVKYNWLLAAAFYITFCTSPWIVNFAPNLYWVEFTWFIPMLIGIIMIMTDMKFKYRWMAYGGVLVTVTAKCLCGYEYISTILIGMIMFPIVECVTSWRNGDKTRFKLCIKLIVGLGCMGVAGFIIALTIHGYMRGSGDVLSGLQNIYQQDVLRRTWGGDISKFPSVYKDSFSASALAVFCKYLIFETKVVVGIPGSLFALLGISPLLIKWYYSKKSNKLPWTYEIWLIYCVGFLATISWLVLAKSHSYIHTHMNFVLWYFGFVQICLYCLLVALRDEIVEILIKNNVLSDEWRERLSK